MTADAPASVPILAIEGLTVVFGTTRGDQTAVRDVSLTVPAGSTVALVGESGSGKSTTAAAVNRLLPANGRVTAGRVVLDGRDLLTLSEREMRRIRGAGIGLVPQDPMSNLDPLMRIGDQVAEALEVHDVANGKAAWARALELLDLVGIPDPQARAAQYPHEFSGGMRQRALIAMGLACRPRLLVADEPTSALDVTVQRRILDTVDAITEELGTSVLLITHDLGLAAERADTVVVMYRGEIVETGPAAHILAEPEHAYTRRLLAAAPSLNTVREVRRTPLDSVAVEPLVRFEGVSKRVRATTSWPWRRRRHPGRRRRVVRHPARADRRHRRRVRFGQVDHREPPAGPGDADGRPHPRRRPDLATMSRRETVRLPAAGAAGVPEPVRVARPALHGRALGGRAAGVHGVGTPRRPPRAGASCSTRSPLTRTSATGCPTSCPAASASASRSPGPSRWSPTSSCSTRRCRHWT